MATLTITVTAGGEFGSACRSVARAIEQAVGHVPDRNSTGASSVLTLDNGTGVCSVRVTAGPYSLMPDGSNSPTIIA